MEFVDVDGLRVGYARTGVGPPLVLVHSAGDDSRIWQPQVGSLADEFTVVAWDEPGAGKSSDVPDGFGLAEFADALAAVIDSLALGPAHVAGLSWGGTVVLELYRRHPERVATLIMIDTYAGWKGSLPAAEVEARVEHTRRMLSAPPERFDATVPGLFAAEPPTAYLSLLADVAAAVRPRTLQCQLDIMARTDLTPVLPQISVPTLLIWGSQDARSPLDIARQFDQAIPDTTLVIIDDAGHLSPLEQPTQVNTAIRDFCRIH